MANDDLAKLDQLTIEEEKMDKDDDSTISNENYLNSKILREVLGKNDSVLKQLCKNDPLVKVKSKVKGIIIMLSCKF